MNRLDEFLASQHQLKQPVKNSYHVAVKIFEALARAKFEQVYLEDEIVHDILGLLEKRFEDSTWNTYVIRLKRFAKWLCDTEDEEYPRVWRKIKLKKVEWEGKLKDKWLTENEIYELLGSADHPRDKALAGITWEGGFRSGEVLGLRIGNCKKKSYGFDVIVSGKTGTRTMQIVLTTPLLETWLYYHPMKHDKQAP